MIIILTALLIALVSDHLSIIDPCHTDSGIHVLERYMYSINILGVKIYLLFWLNALGIEKYMYSINIRSLNLFTVLVKCTGCTEISSNPLAHSL